MTTVYFIRHAQSAKIQCDDRVRPLTDEGLCDTKQVTAALSDKGITHILSSPYKRTLQTVADLSQALGLSVETDEDLRERCAGSWQGENFLEFIEKQWEDFSYHIKDGECLADVQRRNISALNRALKKYDGEIIAIATHGTAFSTIINHYKPEFGFRDFMRIVDFMPYVVKMEFDGERFLSFEEIMYIHKDYKRS